MLYILVAMQNRTIGSLTFIHGMRKEKLTKRDIMCAIAVYKDYISLHGRILVPDLDWYQCLPINDCDVDFPHHGDDQQADLLTIKPWAQQILQVGNHTEWPRFKVFFSLLVCESALAQVSIISLNCHTQHGSQEFKVVHNKASNHVVQMRIGKFSEACYTFQDGVKEAAPPLLTHFGYKPSILLSVINEPSIELHVC